MMAPFDDVTGQLEWAQASSASVVCLSSFSSFRVGWLGCPVVPSAHTRQFALVWTNRLDVSAGSVQKRNPTSGNRGTTICIPLTAPLGVRSLTRSASVLAANLTLQTPCHGRVGGGDIARCVLTPAPPPPNPPTWHHLVPPGTTWYHLVLGRQKATRGARPSRLS